ncbi:hypothetical protein AVEN_169163-1 [Araneus ventricosus]|uniref:Uncharacterized protein n=1 Tax=Araneus ventricosus TaxID=182803 RepID=A0A4Y2KDG6_ARAVE|nr:hypothetical protein AVEN_169163-1 [Araneus ventricosus]
MTKKSLKIINCEGLFRIRNSVKEEFDCFYIRCIAYLNLWGNSFGKTEQFAWVSLTKTNAVDWENAETSAEIINSSLLDVPDMKMMSCLTKLRLLKSICSQIGNSGSKKRLPEM